MKNELDMIKALEDIAKSFGYNMIYFEADEEGNEVMVRFAKPDCVELYSNGEVVGRIAKET